MKGDITKLKATPLKATGRSEDPLATERAFVSRDQRPNKNVAEFASELRKLFKQAYPSEWTTSTVLQQQFLTGLRSPVSQHLLLRKEPDDLT